MRNPEIVQGDITRLSVDAIVNAANETLLGGGGREPETRRRVEAHRPRPERRRQDAAGRVAWRATEGEPSNDSTTPEPSHAKS